MITFLEKHSKIAWFFVIVIAITIFYVSSLSFEGAPLGGFGFKATAYHFIVFFILASFLLPALVKGKNKQLIILAILLAILYGISDEIHQLFVPNRHFSILDILIDSLGILLASLIYMLSLKFRKK